MTHESEATDDKQRKRSRWGCGVNLILGLPVFYVLFLPFAIRLADYFPSFVNFVNWLYFPIIWLMGHYRWVDRLFDWYFSFFPIHWFDNWS